MGIDTLGTPRVLLGGFQPFSLSDFPGRAAAIVFTQGCNWRCPFCHNRALWPSRSPEPPVDTEPEVLSFLSDRKDRLGGVVVTGGEPTLQDGLARFLGKVKGLGLAVKLDTNGSRPEVVAALLAVDLIDYVAMDVKAPPEKYERLCGCPVDMALIRGTIDTITASGVPHHFRTTFYRELLSEADIDALKTLLPAGSKFTLQDYKAPL